jgi:acetylornithine deacetylase
MIEPVAERIRTAIHNQTGPFLDWTKRLIRFASENRPPDGQEFEAQQFILDECHQLGLHVDTFAPDEIPEIEKHPEWLPGRHYQNGRKNVVARWKGSGKGKSLLLSGHADVAPFEPDNWKVCRPYDPVIKEGRLYGRGSADMKGGLASAFWSLKILKEIGFEPQGDIWFESLVDEEFAGGNGTLAARLKGYNADLAVIPEPTQMRICPACFGAFLGDLTLFGRGGMPYTGKEIPNPVQGAARAIELFDEWKQQWRKENHHSLFEEPGAELNVLVWKIESTRPGEFTQMGTPLQVILSWIVWCHPGMDEKRFYSQFREFWDRHGKNDPVLSNFKIEIERKYHFVRPWETPADDPGLMAVRDVFKSSGQSPVIAGAPFSCDLGIYGRQGGMPCVLLGPRGDNLHAPNEWVNIDDLLNLVEIYANLSVVWCGPHTMQKGI